MRKFYLKSVIWFNISGLILLFLFLPGCQSDKSDDRFLLAVKSFSDAMIEHGLDRYGSVHSPMFAADLDLETLRLPDQQPPPPYGVELYELSRYSYGGSNLMWDILTLRSFYLLTEVTANDRYWKAADAYLEFFVNHAPSMTTGLFPWGQHAYWKLLVDVEPERLETERWLWYGDDGRYESHEFESFTPPWREMWEFSPETVINIAQGINDWHIKSEDPVFFNRHGVLYDKNNPGARPPYPPEINERDMAWERHAGLYMYTFLYVYSKTGDEKYLTWARNLSDLYWNVRNPETNRTWPSIWMNREGELILDPRHTGPRSLTVQPYWKLKAYRLAPDSEIAQLLRDRALTYLNVFIQDFPPETGKRVWDNASAQNVEGQMISLAYKVSGNEIFRNWLEEWTTNAFDYRPHAMETGVWELLPGNYANVLVGLLQTHLITGNMDYLNKATILADEALELFQHQSGLIRASARMAANDGNLMILKPYDYYNNHTGVQKLIYVLLQIHIAKNNIEAPVEHMY